MTTDQSATEPVRDAVEAELRSYGISVEAVSIVDEGEERDDRDDRDNGEERDDRDDRDNGEERDDRDDRDNGEERDGETLELSYMTAFPGREVHQREVGRACNALLDMADADQWEPADVEATVVRTPGDVLGYWRAEREWFEDLLAETITETTFSERVVASIDHEGESA